MNSFLLAVIFLFQASPSIQERNEMNWYTIEEAQELMKKEPRKVFVDVVADWCKWCKVMEKETFTDKEVIEYINKHYYAVRMDYESEESVSFRGENMSYKALATSWNVRDLPTIVFWDEGFEDKFLSTGFKKANEFLADLKAFNEF